MTRTHQEEIVDQFSRQAVPFTQVPGHLDAIGLLLEMTGANADDTVLDVACGPGLVACEFARKCGRVIGIDITPAMIAQAEERQREQGLTTLTWSVGDVLPLPFESNSFSLVITRYSFHHFLEPRRVLAEMIRVTRPGGLVAVAGLGPAVDRFFETIAHPALTDVAVDWGTLGASDVYPKVIPDLFVGRPVTLVGRYTGSGEAVLRVWLQKSPSAREQRDLTTMPEGSQAAGLARFRKVLAGENKNSVSSFIADR